MTKEEKMLAIQKMEKNPRVKNLQYDHVILDDEREDSIWYDGWLLSFTLDDKYQITFLASGEKLLEQMLFLILMICLILLKLQMIILKNITHKTKPINLGFFLL